MSLNAVRRIPVVLLHGWGGSSQTIWASNGWVDRLESAGFEPVLIDLPGHGDAEGSYDPCYYADLASYVISRLPQGGPMFGVGYSLGAKLLLEAEAREPGRFERMVLGGLGGNVFAPERLGELLASALESGVTKDTPGAVRALVEYGLKCGNDPRAIAACLRRPANPCISASRLENIDCRTLLVVGDNDAVALPVEPLAAALSSSTVTIIRDVDHLHLPESEGFKSATLEFLSDDLRRQVSRE